MKKKKILLGALVATTAVATLAACTTSNTSTTSKSTDTSTTTTKGGNVDTDTTTDTSTVTDTDTTDTDTTTTTTSTTDTTNINQDGESDEEAYNIALHYDPTSNYENDNVDEVYAPVEVDALGDKYVDFDITNFTPEDDYRTFAGWFYDKEYNKPFDATATIDADFALYAKWDTGSQTVAYGVNVDNDAIAVGKLTSEYVGKNITITSGTEIRKRGKAYTAPDGTSKTYTNGIKIGANTDVIKVVVPADTTMNIFYDDGSSTTDAYLTIYKDAGLTEVYKDEVGKDGDAASSAALLTQVNIEAGTYYITRGAGTIDVFAVEFECVVPLSATSGISVVNTGENYVIEGNEYAGDDIAVQLNYENGSSAVLEKYTVDTTKVDTATPGTYTVTVSYEISEKLYNAEVTKTYTDTYEVVVYELEEIVLGTYATYTAKNGLGTNCYINGSALRIYAVGDTIDSKYITVIANVKNVKTNDETSLILPTSAYTNDSATSFDSANAGVKTITYTYETNGKTKTVSYTVTVTDKTPCVDTETNTINVLVDAAYTGVDGDVALDGSVSRNNFSTINAAMDFLRLYVNQENSSYAGMNIDFKIGAGYYNEKVEFDLPNMTVTGAGRDYKTTTADGATFDETKAHYDFTNTTGTVIEWDSLYGVEDASGYVQTTDSSATVAVRYSAENFNISGVTISNYINTVGKTYTNGEHRALALLVQADKFVMDNCCLYGYQDTVEFFKGRQVVQNTLITGATDFIFGSNNTTYFYKCEIRSVDSEDSKGQATLSGGYITAFKGCSNGAEDAVEYGAIFDTCDFTCDGNVLQTGDTDKDGNTVTSGNTAIARPWGKYAKVAVVNSTLGGHISVNSAATKDSDGTWGSVAGQNARYVQMSGNLPTADTVKFVEYNNTGAGAITDADVAAAIAGLTLITDATEGAKYSSIETIFAKTNGKVTYDDNWLGTQATDVIINYYDGTTLLSTVNDYSGLKASQPDDPKKDGYEFAGWYTEADAEYDFSTTLTAGTLNLYAKWNEAGEKTVYTYTYGGTNTSDWAENFSSKITSADSPSVEACKLSTGDDTENVTLTITSTKKVLLEMTGFTTGSSKASAYLAVDFYSGTTKVGTATGTTGTDKKLATFTFDKADGVYEFDTAIDKIVIHGNTPNKSVGIVTASVTAYQEVDANLISKAKTITFGSGNTNGEAVKFEGSSGTVTIDDVELNVDATTGKFDNTNNANYAQFTTGATVSFKVKAGAKVTIKTYSAAAISYKVGDAEAVNATDTSTEFTASADATIVITAIAIDWLQTITVAY